MFAGGFWGTPLGSDDHLAKERDPPARPTKLEFPNYVPTFRPQPLTHELSSRVRDRICRLRTFADINTADIESLNVSLQKDLPISSLLPSDRFATRPLPFDDDLQAMLNEVGINNEDAFREVLRMAPLPGRKKPRLAYARNFFGSLEDIARYFDQSQDQYYKVPKKSTDKVDRSKATKQSVSSNGDADNADLEMGDDSDKTASDGDIDTKEVYKGYRIGSAESLSPGTRISLLKNLLKTTMHRFQCRDHEPIPQPREKLVVRGVKIQSVQYQFCVARVPQDVRLARARQVEGPIMAVAVRDELRFKEKTGLDTPDKIPFFGEKFDLFREIGCMLILATQRAREGKEKLPTEQKWWVEKERWGGGPTKWGQLAHEIYEDEDPSWSPEEQKLQEEKRKQQAEEPPKAIDTKPHDPNKLVIDDLIASSSPSGTKPTTLPGITEPSTGTMTILPDLDLRPRKKKLRSMERPPGDDVAMKDGRRLVYVPPFRKRWYKDWQKLRPNSPMTDEKIISKRIGVEHDAFDEVFMLTGVNHHVALVKMRVHPDYLAWLESGQAVSDEEIDGMRKDSLYVSRTVWFDMLDVEARKEFLVGLWRVFCWINRDYVTADEGSVRKSVGREEVVVVNRV